MEKLNMKPVMIGDMVERTWQIAKSMAADRGVTTSKLLQALILKEHRKQ